MAIKEKRGKHEYWIDGEGLLVPLKHVPKGDQTRDALVEELTAEATQLQMIVKNAKAKMAARVQAYLEQTAAQYGEKWQGNARIRNFSQTKEVEISQKKLLTFDETLRIAEVKVKDCIKKWATGSRSEIIALVNQAFRVNQKGQLDVLALLKLASLEIEDADWQEAMEIIKESVKVQSTKQYINFRIREESDTWENIPLNFSSL